MRSIRTMALCIVAAFALTAVAAASASAFTTFEAEQYPVTIKSTNTNKHVFKVETGTSECGKATFEGSSSAPSATLTVKPLYTECQFVPLGKLAESAEVKMNGCEYTLNADGEVSITPEPCGPITVKAATCEVKVGAQKGLKAITYTNVGTGKTREVEVASNVSGITYEESTLCTKPGVHSNGTYEGTVKSQGFNSLSEQEGITVTNAPHWQKNSTKIKEGEKVPTIGWGAITLEPSSGGTVICKTAVASNVENTAALAKAETVLFSTYECKATSTKCATEGGETRVGAPGLPSLEVMKEEVEGGEAYRAEGTGVQLNIECYKAGVLTEHALFKSGPVGAETGTFTPALLNGATAGRPSEASFDASSGHLFAEGGVKLTTKGKVKTEGYEGTPVPLLTLGPHGSS